MNQRNNARNDRPARNDRQRRDDRNQRDDRPARKPRISPARLVAYDVLRDVEDREAYANLALPARIREAELDGRDAALATELVSGTLRWRGRYDAIIALAAKRKIEDIDPRTRNVLRLGAHQMLGMRTAAHAAVNESVELQRHVANRGADGFVNGVLRQIGRADNAEWDERITADAPTADEALAARTSHPVWIVRALRDALTLEGRADELHTLLEADNASPRVSLALLPGADVTPDALAAEREDLETTGFAPTGLELAGGDPGRVISKAGVREGYLRVQDQGSQLAALALTRVRPIEAGERWLDLCAGPGGKTALLGAEALTAENVTVRANEVSPHRADLVRRSVAGVADVVEVVSHDGRDHSAYGGSEARFDRILVDAPCSGLGALRRRPEARWRKAPSDIPELANLQGELLDAAFEHLAVGGVLAYVTCSPHLAETRVAIKRWTGRHDNIAELDAKDVIRRASRGEIDLAGATKSVQLWPHRHGTDAMFIALFERTA
ncbi:rRNA small subunit methyltransferase B [Leucobacter sp. cx-42]|uniref:transcription antitermination factor NusB n=1 Tax=unclassified Leucobacter TaxID=2621730 RepID=UPI00165DFEAD|nr:MULTISPECIES: transcription antitermination factor NusB [unclassified Leucobacter]MBC9954792.1 rRNA small subunit methyltransferase B [Leucobacter sp. cx-42]